MPRTTETYVPLSRGLLDHLPRISGTCLKIYLAMLILAKPVGDDRGQLRISVRDLSEVTGIGIRHIQNGVAFLCEHGYITRINLGTNQYATTAFRVERYKTVADFAVSHRETAGETARETPGEQRGNSGETANAEDASNDASSGAPNNIENIDNGENISTAERNILNSLKSLPSYPFDFEKDLKFLRQLLIDFPDVSDITAELKSTAAWLLDHKAPKNYRLFIRNWIKKSSEYGRNENGRNMEGNGRSAEERTRGGGKYSPPSPRGDFRETGIVTDW